MYMAQTVTLKQSDYKKLTNRIARLENMFSVLIQTLRSKPELTVNGFIPDFEQRVIDAEKEPVQNDIVFQSDRDVIAFFKQLKTG